MFKPDLGAGLSTPVPLTCFCPGIPCVLPEWHENLGCTGPISRSVISQINDFSPYSNYFFFFCLSQVIAFPGCGHQSYVDFLFASSKAHVHMGGENVLNAKDYISPSVVAGSMVTVTESKGNANAEVAAGAGTPPLCIRLVCIYHQQPWSRSSL